MSFIDDHLDDERMWNIVALVSAALAAILVRNLLQQSWKLVKHDDPPKNPAARSVDWGDALAWTIASGMAAGVGRMLAQRGAAAGWKKVKGHYPEGLD
jgi:hypothetical protein